MPTFRTRTTRRAAALFAASTAVVLISACGGGDSGDSATGAQDAPNSAFTAYVDCMKQNGVTITAPSGGGRTRPSDGATRSPGDVPSGDPRPSGGAGLPGRGSMNQKPEGVDDATWQKAQTACASVRPTGRPGGQGNGNAGNGQNAAFRNCLTENGVTDTANLDMNDATVKKAVQTCEVLRASPTA